MFIPYQCWKPWQISQRKLLLHMVNLTKHLKIAYLQGKEYKKCIGQTKSFSWDYNTVNKFRITVFITVMLL